MGCRCSKASRRSRQCHHVVMLKSSTLGSLRLDRSPLLAGDGVDVDDGKPAKNRPNCLLLLRTPTKTPENYEPEVIDVDELMAGLEDYSPLPPEFDPDAKNRPLFAGIVRARVAAFQARIDAKRLSAKLRPPPPPESGRKAVVYLTSLRGVRKTYEDCGAVIAILSGYKVRVDERDVSMHAGFKDDLRAAGVSGKQLPQVFVNGKYIGGADEVRRMHEHGELLAALSGCEAVSADKAGAGCSRCGSMRFLLCGVCSGSCKVFVDDGGFRRCTACNENGLIRCPLCC